VCLRGHEIQPSAGADGDQLASGSEKESMEVGDFAVRFYDSDWTPPRVEDQTTRYPRGPDRCQGVPLRSLLADSKLSHRDTIGRCGVAETLPARA
jgi:hypothetical protein